MDIIQATKFVVAIAKRAGLDDWQCGKAEDYQEKGINAYVHYLNLEDRPKFIQAVIDIANERGYM